MLRLRVTTDQAFRAAEGGAEAAQEEGALGRDPDQQIVPLDGGGVGGAASGSGALSRLRPPCSLSPQHPPPAPELPLQLTPPSVRALRASHLRGEGRGGARGFVK